MGEDRCVCCGEIIPEGNHVCPNCRENHIQQLYSGTAKKAGEEIGRMTGTINEVANWAEMEIRSNGSVEINIRRLK